MLRPKPPGTGVAVDWVKFEGCLGRAGRAQTVMEIGIFDATGYSWARDVAQRYPDLPLYLQPGNHTPPPPEAEDAEIDMGGIMNRYEWLIDKALGDRWYRPTILPQLHVLVWGNKRGV